LDGSLKVDGEDVGGGATEANEDDDIDCGDRDSACWTGTRTGTGKMGTTHDERGWAWPATDGDGDRQMRTARQTGTMRHMRTTMSELVAVLLGLLQSAWM
jgi:hypothetical protein